MTPMHVKRRRKLQAVYVAALTIAWVLFWGDVSVGNVVAGALIATVLTLALPMPTIPYAGRIRPIGLIRLTTRFLYDVVVASIEVAWQVFQFGRQPQSVIVEMNMRSDSDLYLTITAEMISLVPGTLAIELERPSSTMLVHVFGIRDDLEERIQAIRDQEARVLRAFASDEELERAYPFVDEMLPEGDRA